VDGALSGRIMWSGIGAEAGFRNKQAGFHSTCQILDACVKHSITVIISGIIREIFDQRFCKKDTIKAKQSGCLENRLIFSL